MVSKLFRLGRVRFLLYSPVAYITGCAFAWGHEGIKVELPLMLVGAFFISVAHAMTHFFNEYYDYDTDVRHKDPSPWTGGSRVLPSGELPRSAALYTGYGLLAFELAMSALLQVMAGGDDWTVGFTCVLILWFSVEYSAPPFRLEALGCGEADVVITLNVLTPLLGWQLQRIVAGHAAPLLGVPMGLLCVLIPASMVEYPRMMVMNMADIDADVQSDKWTLPARIGLRKAQLLHNTIMTCAYLVPTYLWYTGTFGTIQYALFLTSTPFAAFQLVQIPKQPWQFTNPFWATQHNAYVMLIMLIGEVAASWSNLTLLARVCVATFVAPALSTWPILVKEILNAVAARAAAGKGPKSK